MVVHRVEVGGWRVPLVLYTRVNYSSGANKSTGYGDEFPY